MMTVRQNKISRLLQKEIAEIFQREMPNTFPGVMITVTEARISPDLSVAKIFVTFFSSRPFNGKNLIEELREKSHEVRGHLGFRVKKQLRITPEIIFYLDDTYERAE